MIEIIQHPNALLRETSIAVDKVNVGLVNEMGWYKDKLLGLSAIQLGYPVRLIMVKSGSFYEFMVNPEIVKMDAKMATYYEGCMSIENGNARYSFERPRRVKVRYLDLMMRPRTIKGDGLFSRILQQELRRLDGKMIICSRDGEMNGSSNSDGAPGTD